MGREHMSTTISPLSTGTALSAVTPAQIIGSNVSRTALLIHNPNVSGTIWIAPLGTTPTANGGGSFMIVAGADRLFTDTTRATCGWSAVMGTGSGFASVLEFLP
jgi:hypothetical protein